jgi:hypothetical protein
MHKYKVDYTESGTDSYRFMPNAKVLINSFFVFVGNLLLVTQKERKQKKKEGAVGIEKKSRKNIRRKA